MIIEIGYNYQSDKNSPVQTSWTYFYVKGDDFEKNKKKAQTYWKRFVADLGWQKKVKLVHIEEIRNGQTYTINSVIVDSSELPPARERRSAPKARASSPPKKPRTSSRSRTSSPKKKSTPVSRSSK